MYRRAGCNWDCLRPPGSVEGSRWEWDDGCKMMTADESILYLCWHHEKERKTERKSASEVVVMSIF
jgi:hypothetical protein